MSLFFQRNATCSWLLKSSKQIDPAKKCGSDASSSSYANMKEADWFAHWKKKPAVVARVLASVTSDTGHSSCKWVVGKLLHNQTIANNQYRTWSSPKFRKQQHLTWLAQMDRSKLQGVQVCGFPFYFADGDGPFPSKLPPCWRGSCHMGQDKKLLTARIKFFFLKLRLFNTDPYISSLKTLKELGTL